MSIRPVFILALPRSGSTLVQRVLATYPEVATRSEPWLLLPLLSPLSSTDPEARPWQRSVDNAFREFVGGIPDGDDAYLKEVRSLALSMYRRAAGDGATLFVDKTPPYHLIVEQVFRAFPDGLFVFLWRHPLANVVSIMETFCRGRWRPDRFRGTLFKGLTDLIDAYERHRDKSLALRFEDLLGPDRDSAWSQLSAHLGLSHDPRVLEEFSQTQLSGSLGDHTGARLYDSLSTEPLEKWQQKLGSPLRRAWCARYLNWIGDRRLAVMGYDGEHLRTELRSCPDSWSRLPGDLRDLGVSVAREVGGSVIGGRHPGSWATLFRQPAEGKPGMC